MVGQVSGIVTSVIGTIKVIVLSTVGYLVILRMIDDSIVNVRM